MKCRIMVVFSSSIVLEKSIDISHTLTFLNLA